MEKSFEGWEPKEFLKGRKKLIVAAIGAGVGWVLTNRPEFAAMAAAGSELLFAVLEYWWKEN